MNDRSRLRTQWRAGLRRPHFFDSMQYQLRTLQYQFRTIRALLGVDTNASACGRIRANKLATQRREHRIARLRRLLKRTDAVLRDASKQQEASRALQRLFHASLLRESKYENLVDGWRRLARRQQQVVDAQERKLEQYLCTICCDRVRDVALLPCGHASFCRPCIRQWQDARPLQPYPMTCPLCREIVDQTVRLFGT